MCHIILSEQVSSIPYIKITSPYDAKISIVMTKNIEELKEKYRIILET